MMSVLKKIKEKLPDLPKRKTVSNMNYPSLKGPARIMQSLERDTKKLHDYATAMKKLLKDIDKLDVERSKCEDGSEKLEKLNVKWKEKVAVVEDYYKDCCQINKEIEKSTKNFYEEFFGGYYGTFS